MKRKASQQLTKDRPKHDTQELPKAPPQADQAKMAQRKLVQPKKRVKTNAEEENAFAKLVKKDVWTCDECFVPNPLDKKACMACESPRPQAEDATATTVEPENAFAKLVKKDQWTCDECFVPNPLNKTTCMACDLPRGQASTEPAPEEKDSQSAKEPENAFAKLIKKDQWTCDECFVSNPMTKTACMACESPREPKQTKETKEAPAAAAAADTPEENVFAKLMPKNQWTCDECLVPNPNSASKCRACETPKCGAKDDGPPRKTLLPTPWKSEKRSIALTSAQKAEIIQGARSMHDAGGLVNHTAEGGGENIIFDNPQKGEGELIQWL
eukprot:g27536.t1